MKIFFDRMADLMQTAKEKGRGRLGRPTPKDPRPTMDPSAPRFGGAERCRRAIISAPQSSLDVQRRSGRFFRCLGNSDFGFGVAGWEKYTQRS